MHRPESSLRIVLHGQELLREFRRRRFDQRTAQLVAGGGDIGEFILRDRGADDSAAARDNRAKVTFGVAFMRYVF